MTHDNVLAQLHTMNDYRLESIYNRASRDAHNDINEASSLAVMALIEIVMASRGFCITGSTGKYEFISINERNI